MKKTLKVIIILIIILLAIFLIYKLYKQNTTNSSQDKSALASSTVVNFGLALRQVSLLAPNASQTMASVYAPYVTSELLLNWENNLEIAPGKTVSSPWPDHIEIVSVNKQADDSYEVQGKIILMTSNELEHGGIYAYVPFNATLVKESGSLKIADFQKGDLVIPNQTENATE